MLMYLSENVEGGETYFPMVSIFCVDSKFPSLTMFFFCWIYVLFPTNGYQSLVLLGEEGRILTMSLWSDTTTQKLTL